MSHEYIPKGSMFAKVRKLTSHEKHICMVYSFDIDILGYLHV